MTEAEWLTCDEPALMLEFLQDKVSERKLRLFAVACCRRISQLLAGIVQDALEVAERFAEKIEGDAERVAARKAAQRMAQGRNVTRTPTAPKWERRAASSVYYAAAHDTSEAAWNACQLAVEALFLKSGGYADMASLKSRFREAECQAHLLRDIVGNAVRPLTSVPACHLTWNDATVPRIAEGIYAERAFERMPILADALLDAGCDDGELIAHLRSPGPHVRGCWALDLLTGRE